MAMKITRRVFVAALPMALAACQGQRESSLQAGLDPLPDGLPDYASAYAPIRDGGFSLPGVPFQNFDDRYLRQVVYYPSRYPEGTIIVDPNRKFLYLTRRNGRAIRYGIGVGRAGFAWNGEAYIRYKRVWPKWFPPAEMIERDPKLAKYKDGQAGGPSNPIGARGLYLWQGNKDTLYRIHGTNSPASIGTNASSGCIRMWHQDIIDLYERVNTGAKVIVL